MNKTKKSLLTASCVMLVALAALQSNQPTEGKISNATMGATYMSSHSEENGAGWAAAAGALGTGTGIAYKLAGVSFVTGIGSVPWLVGAGVLGL